ncbi:DNA-binding transcriptional activator of the SARP family [Mycobacterium sp. JS623]|uniref:AfsR/SARP family transcriptional regulator n=1 Tax=Mycobacterium sp. JS623 TaxID=212767 RepID=UPI0002A58EF7|nr:BTAD domain-containing putative transcriptional regulator [Mycobacterium sp. JS623]AGB24064.1 DNA-binding transcriptional activator of the SARP family [Mycobacterium sp. JS623]
MTIQSDVRGGRPAELSLFGGFALRVGGQKISLPMHARRVLAYLSLHKMMEKDCDRQVLAERLWTDSSPRRSRASLRTAIWRIRSAADDLILGDSDRVALADSVRVDVHDFRHNAERMLSDVSACEPPRLVPHLRSPADLLPGWDEDWLLLTREQLRLLRLHALEHTARRMSESGLYPQAIDVILFVVDEEPLRESAQAILIKAHLAAGNLADACRQYHRFRANLWNELGLRPSADLSRLVSPQSERATT